MIALIVILSVILIAALLIAIRERKKAVRSKYLEAVIPYKINEKQTWLMQLLSYKNKDTQMYVAMIVGGVLAGSFALSRGGNFIISGVAVAAVIGAIFKQREYSYEVSYRKNGKKAVEYLKAVVSAGGTLEEWLEEVVPKLSGPLGRQFASGYENYKFNSVPISKLLQSLLDNSPDSSLSLIWAGLLRESKQGGDLQLYVEGALDDLSNQERMNRILGAARKSGGQLLAMTCVLPVTLYFLFSEVLKTVLANHPTANIALLILMGGYGAILWWGLKITAPRKRS